MEQTEEMADFDQDLEFDVELKVEDEISEFQKRVLKFFKLI